MKAGSIGIAGVGLIGGSVALRARALRIPVLGFDADPAALARAVGRGALDATAADVADLAGRCETLVIALPVDATCAALRSLAGRGGPLLVIDVASVKRPTAAAGAAVSNFVGTHPMAGREQGGIEAADAGLFEDATWAYVPAPDAALVERARAFIGAMGARPLAIEAARHDAVVALTSHLPQALSVLLAAELGVAAQDDSSVMEMCGPGMMSMLRLAKSPEGTWAPIVAANADQIAPCLRALADALDAAAAGLEQGESARLMSYFAGARAAADRLEERFPPAPRSATCCQTRHTSRLPPPSTR